MFLIFTATGSLTYTTVFQEAETLTRTTATAISLLLFVGACGKSAQLPLYVWLPDAMEGPTPVSALIHAATMVTAGVFLMCRVNPILDLAPTALTVIAVVGAVTALFAATVACAQKDIKKVLAYSTVSQLGYMFLAVGTGAYVAAIFHMVTHAFFKALLFLGAGSVIHGLHDEQDMGRMGGLRKWMPITYGTFIVGWLAIAGVPPFSGFWSKDEILAAAWDVSPVLWAVGLVTALLTAYYMSRQVFLVFFGEERWKKAPAPTTQAAAATPEHEPAATVGHAGGDHDGHGVHGDGAHGDFKPHESPATMAVPLVVLAVLAALGGLLNLPFGGYVLEHFLEPVFGDRLHHLGLTSGAKVVLAMVAIAASLTGITIAALTYLKGRLSPFEPKVLERAWYVDDLYSEVVGEGGRKAATATARFDAAVVDGAVNGAAAAVRAAGGRLRSVQTGYVRHYALAVAAGTVGILAFVVSRS
jgi:NADH-quinone oxidoreductase subunit L